MYWFIRCSILVWNETIEVMRFDTYCTYVQWTRTLYLQNNGTQFCVHYLTPSIPHVKEEYMEKP